MKVILFFIILFNICYITNSLGQDRKVYGRIYDLKTNKALDYVTVKVADTSYGTAADRDGSYFIKLSPGAHKLIFSFIGYFTDTANVFIQDADVDRDIYLKPSEIMTEVIEVLGEDPAYDIIRKAIKYKKLFREKLNEYHYSAYTKYIFRSDRSTVKADSLTKEKYPIIAILESETDGYFRKPDEYKEIVKAKRETANINRGFAIPFIVNFYDESLDLGQPKITGPLADDALDYYSYKLLGITSIDSTKVFKIQVDGSGMYPLFDGKIYIADSTFALMKVDLSVNDAAKPTAIDELNFKQKFSAYTDKNNNKFWLPTDIEISAEGGIAGIFSFTGDVFTIISDYELNKKIPPGIFDEFAIQVLPNAKKDSSYWKEHQLVKSSSEEKSAYGQIEKKSNERKSKVSVGLTAIRIGKYINSYPLNYFHYNRVEGSHMQFNLSMRNKSRRFKLDSYIGYGFSDKKTKYEVNLSNEFGKKRDTRVEAGFYQMLQPLSFEMTGFYNAYNTLTGLFDKRDFFDYYYSTGYYANVSHTIIPQISVALKYRQEKQSSAFKNTDYSFRKKDQPFRDNPLINDGFLRIVGLGITLDPNKYKFIDYGDGEISSFTETDYPQLNLGVDYSSKNLGSTFEYKKYFASIEGENYFNRFINLRYKTGAEYYAGSVPLQSLGYFSALGSTIKTDFSFKTMGYREFLGDRLYYFLLENDFGGLLPVKSGFLRKIHLIGFFNAGRSEISDNSRQFLSNADLYQTDKTFMESGFGLGGIFDLLRIDFAWRLNNKKEGNNFKFSISAPGF